MDEVGDDVQQRCIFGQRSSVSLQAALGHPRTDLAFLMSLSECFLSAVDEVFLRQTTPCTILPPQIKKGVKKDPQEPPLPSKRPYSHLTTADNLLSTVL